MTRRFNRIPRPFVATGLAAVSLAGTMGLCATTVMAASHPLTDVILSVVG